MPQKIKALIFSLIGLISYSALALTTDADQPIEIQADLVELDEQSGTNRYIGNVRMSQGSIEISAHQLEITSVKEEIERLIVTGTSAQQATFRQLSDEGQEILAHAEHIEYLEKSNRLILSGNATLSKNQNLIRGEKIDYNTRSHKLVAGAQAETDKKERVHIIIQPKSTKQ